ncbi:class C sortase [Paucilactobacillus kaifaensis]|uniref:class C sortase n=1 Tax=Paucilactobacillus kaifaensis TaxID=2559921 RepID=UPI0010F57C17|nr:class C sortase [Paucilactobacillus kaifaensis]
MKSKFRQILIVTLFVFGVGVLCYPLAQNIYAWNKQNAVVSEYRHYLSKMSDQKKDQIVTWMDKYNPWSSKDNQSKEKKKKNTYSVEELAVLGTITIPKIRVDLPIYDGTSDRQLKKGVGLLKGTDMITGGKGKHSVLTAHRGLPGARLFTDLPKLKIGDKFYLQTPAKLMTYKVDQIKTIKPNQINSLKPVASQDYMTLMTCTPYMLNTHRLLVRGHRIPNDRQTPPKVKSPIWGYILGLIAVAMASLFAAYRFWKNSRGGTGQ